MTKPQKRCIIVLTQQHKEVHTVWQFNNREPVFFQIAGRLRAEILSGKYTAREQFPSVRQIAADASVNPNTVQRALLMLEADGLLYNKGTVGRFVTEDKVILDNAREKMRRETVRGMISQAEALGISLDELIKIIKEEGREK